MFHWPLTCLQNHACAKFVTHLFACLGQPPSLSGSLLVVFPHRLGMSSPHLHLEVRTYLHPYPPWVCEYLDPSYLLRLLTICIDCRSRAYAPNSSLTYLLAWDSCCLCPAHCWWRCPTISGCLPPTSTWMSGPTYIPIPPGSVSI